MEFFLLHPSSKKWIDRLQLINLLFLRNSLINLFILDKLFLQIIYIYILINPLIR